MSNVDQYVNAATRQNTRRSYQAAVEHFEVSWGGLLPATADSIARYLACCAGQFSVNTLKLRLAALGQWHIEQGFPDPTKAPLVKKVLKGIRELHPAQEKQATPLQIMHLESLDVYWATRLEQLNDPTAILRIQRNRALVLLGFWRAFRSDELCRVEVQNMVIDPNNGMTIFLPRSKSDRNNQGRKYRCPALSRLCPVTACQSWVRAASIQQGPLFRGIDRWGHLRLKEMHANSVIPLLRAELKQAGIERSSHFSSHSLRRGFASWANSNDWDVKSLMEYVGWKDVSSALRYIEGADPFKQQSRRRL